MVTNNKIRTTGYILFRFFGYIENFKLPYSNDGCVEPQKILDHIHVNDKVSIWVKPDDLPTGELYMIEHNNERYGNLECHNQSSSRNYLAGAIV